MTEEPKKPSTLMIVASALMTLYFLYKLLFAGGEAMSGTLTAMYWGVVVLNLFFLIFTALQWKK